MRRHASSGSAAVELALVLPLALMLALALIQVGLVSKDTLLVAQAAREGARQAAVSLDEARVRDAALLGGGSLAGDRTEVQVDRAGTVGDPVTVRVRYRAPMVVPFLDWLLPGEVEIEAEATMRQETAGDAGP
jgi:Flp pilus assembly protein TadG